MLPSAPGDALTPIQERALDHIRSQVEGRGVPPTVRELGVFMGHASTNATIRVLRVLEKKGRIRRDSKARNITLVEKSRAETLLARIVTLVTISERLRADGKDAQLAAVLDEAIMFLRRREAP